MSFTREYLLTVAEHADDTYSIFEKQMAKQILELQSRLQHTQANHKDMVERNAVLRDRTDLAVDRTKAYRRLEELQQENAELKARIDGGIRVGAWKFALKGVIYSATNTKQDNATLILDDGVAL